MVRISTIIIVCLAFVTEIQAQKRGVVINMETGFPLANVQLSTNTNVKVLTDYQGRFYIPTPFTSITFAKSHFVPLSMRASQMCDTISLLPKFNTLEEVVVWGKRPKIAKEAMKATPNYPVFNAPTSTGLGFDFVKVIQLFRRRVGLTKKQREKHDWIIKNY